MRDIQLAELRDSWTAWLGVALHAEALALPVALLGLAGDAAATDPVCVKSPLHGRVTAMAEAFSGETPSGEAAELIWRRFPEPEAV